MSGDNSGDLENVVDSSSGPSATQDTNINTSGKPMSIKDMEDIDNFSDTDDSDDADNDLTDISEQQNSNVGLKEEKQVHEVESKDHERKVEETNEEGPIISKENDKNLVEVSTNCNLITDDPSKSSKDVEVNVNISTTPIGTDDDNTPEPQMSEGETRYKQTAVYECPKYDDHVINNQFTNLSGNES